MVSLAALRMKYKLMLMLFFPMLGLLYFAVSGLTTDYRTYTRLENLQSLSSLAVKSSALVHELQKERGMSAGFLGSKGQAFSSQLRQQRLSTNKKIEEFRAGLGNGSAVIFGGGIDSFASNALGDIKSILTRRNAIDALNIETKSALKYYTGINTALLNIVAEIAKISTEADITRAASAYSNFLQSKERAGIERAVLSNTFAAHKFDPGMFNKFSSLVAQQKAYMDAFLLLSTAEERKFYQAKMTGPFMVETREMRGIAFGSATGNIEGVESTYWFKMQTGKINLLKETEDWLSGGLYTKAEELKNDARNRFIVAMLITSVPFALTLLIAFAVLRNITHSLTQAVNLSSTIAKGDLTMKIEIEGSDEFAELQQAMHTMNGSLHEIIDKVRANSETIQLGANEIAHGNLDLSGRTEEQASSLEETASSMEEMTATVMQNADNAHEANKLANVARDQALNGGEVVTKAVTAMDDINHASKRIADIIGVIDEIAFQTNLLALNAAVEAARAGEQGRGFAVVATEVRNLAQRSASAAKEIKGLIQDSVDKVKTGTELVDQSGETLTGIVNRVTKVSDIVSEIAAASQEQSDGIGQVNKAIMQMDGMTQQNAALVEEATRASRAMHEQSEQLVDATHFFQLGDSTDASVNEKRDSAKDKSNVRHISSGKQKSTLPVRQVSDAATVSRTGTDADKWEEF